MNTLNDENIYLITETHNYKLKDNQSIEFTSCTTFIKYFFKQFDSIGIANHLTSTHPKYIGTTPQDLVATWDKKADEGTIIHYEIEQFIKEGTEPTKPQSQKAVEWIRGKINNKYKMMSEVIVYSEELELAGTIDMLLYDNKDKSYKILDWKTNNKLSLSSFNKKMGTHKAASHLEDCNFNHYSLQLSLYRYLLEKYYKLKVTGTAIIHLDNNKIKTYKTHYFKDEIEAMLLADRAELQQKAENSLTKEYI